MNKKHRTLLLVGVLLVATVILSGCTIPQGDIDLDNPPGPWERFIVYPLAEILMALNGFLQSIGITTNSWGWAIIIFTIIVKLVTLPLTLKQLQSTKAQQQIQPKMRELQEKYGKDRQKLAEEQMKLYKEAGINPMGGCLPMLIQLPILWGLYQALYVLANPSINELNGQPFYWIPDLSLPALTTPGSTPPTLPGYPDIPMAGTSWIGPAFQQQEWVILFAYFSLPILMLLTQMFVQKMAQPAKAATGGQQDPQTRMMNQMMFFMPIMFAWITLGLPAGLTLYWTVSNILAVIQQYFVTGWGGLADWLPFLRTGQPALATTGGSSTSARSSSSGSTNVTAGSTNVTASPRTTSETPDKPSKRRKRRR